MDEVIYAVLELGLVGLVYLLMNTVTTVRRNNFVHIASALGRLVRNMMAACWYLVAGARGGCLYHLEQSHWTFPATAGTTMRALGTTTTETDIHLGQEGMS